MLEQHILGLLEDQADVLSGDDDFEGIAITGDDVEEAAYASVMGASSAPQALSYLSRMNIPGNARLAQASKARIAALATGARAVIRVAEAQSARDALRPNSYCPFSTGQLAPTASVTITVQPGGGNGTWKFMGLYVPDYFQSVFGLSSLTIAGQQVLYGTSTVAGVAPATSGVSIGVFGSRSPWNLNLTPWMGRTFMNNQAIVFTFVNQTSATDFFDTQSPVSASLNGAVLTQVDPCNVSLPGVDTKLSRKAVIGATKNALSPFARFAR